MQVTDLGKSEAQVVRHKIQGTRDKAQGRNKAQDARKAQGTKEIPALVLFKY